MKTESLIRRRDENFIKVVRDIIDRRYKAGRFATPSVIISEALDTQPDRYYLSCDTVLNRLPRMRRDRLSGGSDKASRMQWHDLNAAVDRYLARHAGARLADAVAYVIAFERPRRFYISDRVARDLFHRAVRRTVSSILFNTRSYQRS